MPYVESSIEIKGDIEEVYKIASDMESYPQFMENVNSVEVLKREEDKTITAWVTEVDGRKLTWRERDIFDFQKNRIYYEQIEGDLKKFSGEWRFAEKDEITEVMLTVDFDFGIPMLAPLLNPILKKKVISNSESMLSAIKQKAESEELHSA
jgi:ribosome-associated toxin RatA of RatAB toxin-antitoxin module